MARRLLQRWVRRNSRQALPKVSCSLRASPIAIGVTRWSLVGAFVVVELAAEVNVVGRIGTLGGAINSRIAGFNGVLAVLPANIFVAPDLRLVALASVISTLVLQLRRVRRPVVLLASGIVLSIRRIFTQLVQLSLCRNTTWTEAKVLVRKAGVGVAAIPGRDDELKEGQSQEQVRTPFPEI